ncbi:unnamed protein product, partial [Ectocarpus fasciculatus]
RKRSERCPCAGAKCTRLILRTRWWPQNYVDGEYVGWRVGTESGVPGLHPGRELNVGCCLESSCVRKGSFSISAEVVVEPHGPGTLEHAAWFLGVGFVSGWLLLDISCL